MLFYSAQIKVETQGELMLNVHLSFPGLAERRRRDFATQFRNARWEKETELVVNDKKIRKRRQLETTGVQLHLAEVRFGFDSWRHSARPQY